MPNNRDGFTLVELLVVMGIIAVLLGIMMPVAVKIRRQGRTLLGVNNQRQIAEGLNLYAVENSERYPESVATVGVLWHWNWTEPMMLTGYRARSPRTYRSMSAYLGDYIADAGIMFCPNAPRRYKYLFESWEAGEDWDNPDTGPVQDPVSGTYCFWWNYVGYLGPGRRFVGPKSPLGGPGQSKLLVSCYFGYDHWRSRGAYGSCEKLKGGEITPGTEVSSAYWSLPADVNSPMPTVRLSAAYTDGHVESFSSPDVVPMRVSIESDGSVPYLEGVGPGYFLLPRSGLH